MSGNDQSEEKTLPASDKKLRDVRKKGQVAQSKDMVIGTGTVAILAYVWLAWDRLQDNMIALLILPADVYDMPFLKAVERVAGIAFELAVMTVLPLIVIVILVSVLTNVAVMQGFVFSTEPIKPKGEKINPVSGFKRIFSLKNLVELIKSILKTVLLSAAAIVLVVLGLETLLKGPVCGPDCIAIAFTGMVKPLFIAFALIFLLFALLDIGVQRWLFLRDMRMTITEFKRERKDMEGDPTLRHERMRQRREFTDGGEVPIGIRNATVLIADGMSSIVGIRYIKGRTPVPAIVCKGRNDRAAQLAAAAHQLFLSASGMGLGRDDDSQVIETYRALAKKA
ncbi:MAG: translocation protein in type III secretion system, RhcU [Rhizobiales bacterium]|nr:translocation protein in type III secretion system, RhcU [Hyphomicrobiales bacterium]